MMIVNGSAALYAACRAGRRALRPRPVRLSGHRQRYSLDLALVGPLRDQDAAGREARQEDELGREQGPADNMSDGAAFTCEALGLDCHVVLGYAGSNQAALSGHPGARWKRDLHLRHVGQQLRSERAAACRGRDGPDEVALLSGPADHLRSAQADARSAMAV